MTSARHWMQLEIIKRGNLDSNDRYIPNCRSSLLNFMYVICGHKCAGLETTARKDNSIHVI